MNKNVSFLNFQISIKTSNISKNQSLLSKVNKMRQFVDYDYPNNFIFNMNYDATRDEMIYTIFMISKKNFKLESNDYEYFLEVIDID